MQLSHRYYDTKTGLFNFNFSVTQVDRTINCSGKRKYTQPRAKHHKKYPTAVVWRRERFEFGGAAGHVRSSGSPGAREAAPADPNECDMQAVRLEEVAASLSLFCDLCGRVTGLVVVSFRPF